VPAPRSHSLHHPNPTRSEAFVPFPAFLVLHCLLLLLRGVLHLYDVSFSPFLLSHPHQRLVLLYPSYHCHWSCTNASVTPYSQAWAGRCLSNISFPFPTRFCSPPVLNQPLFSSTHGQTTLFTYLLPAISILHPPYPCVSTVTPAYRRTCDSRCKYPLPSFSVCCVGYTFPCVVSSSMSCVEFIFRHTVSFSDESVSFFVTTEFAFVCHSQRLTLEPAGWQRAQHIEWSSIESNDSRRIECL
jgi:hypothetical protein